MRVEIPTTVRARPLAPSAPPQSAPPQPCLQPSLSFCPAAHTRRAPSWQATCTSRSSQSAIRPLPSPTVRAASHITRGISAPPRPPTSQRTEMPLTAAPATIASPGRRRPRHHPRRHRPRRRCPRRRRPRPRRRRPRRRRPRRRRPRCRQFRRPRLTKPCLPPATSAKAFTYRSMTTTPRGTPRWIARQSAPRAPTAARRRSGWPILLRVDLTTTVRATPLALSIPPIRPAPAVPSAFTLLPPSCSHATPLPGRLHALPGQVSLPGDHSFDVP